MTHDEFSAGALIISPKTSNIYLIIDADPLTLPPDYYGRLDYKAAEVMLVKAGRGSSGMIKPGDIKTLRFNLENMSLFSGDLQNVTE